ncbi:MAG: hypothetical protein CML03_10170 [Pseudooceanicola sp.]|nr:hypothetical protein [Pseudooceanicola sp.]
MSDVMMKVLQLQNESLTRQVETLGPENERVRNLLTEFNKRHDADQAEIERLRVMAYQPTNRHEGNCDCFQCVPF